MRFCGLFSGIGGFELAFARAGFETNLLCENDPAARSVLRRHFPETTLASDVRELRKLPECEILAAGWPCQDLSQAGRAAGLSGKRSGLLSEIFRLIDSSKRPPRYVLLENVAFALSLRKGEAIQAAIRHLEARGYSWAYRILDSREFGLPQRRRRIYILGSLDHDPASILLDAPPDDMPENGPQSLVGFYWTEGNRGVGWTSDGVPPLKGGSGFSIPSPPAVWSRRDGTFFCPGLVDGERLQGFPPGWTSPATEAGHDRSRWRLVGNAVSVPVVAWIARRLLQGASAQRPPLGLVAEHGRAHNAAFGGPGRTAVLLRIKVEGPASPSRVALAGFELIAPKPLSTRAASGFLSRLLASRLNREQLFVQDLGRWCGHEASGAAKPYQRLAKKV